MVEGREITSHRVGAVNKQLRIFTFDEPNSKSPIVYMIELDHVPICQIRFINGSIRDGINGITVDALLAIAEDRLAMQNASPFGNREASVAITNLQTAMMFLQKRIRDIEMDSE